MDYQLTEDAVTAEPQPVVFPFVIQGHEVVVLVCPVYGFRYPADEVCIVGFHQPLCRIEERHRAVNAYAHIDAMLLGYSNDMAHVLECVPWGEAEHQRYRHHALTGFHHFHHLVIPVPPPHIPIGLPVAVERNVQMLGTMVFHGCNHLFGGKAVGQQGVVGMMHIKPSQYLVSLGMQDKLSSLQPHHCAFGHAFAVHDLDDIVQTQIFYGLLPNGAMLATGLAAGSGINHQRRKLLVLFAHHVVYKCHPIVDVVINTVHCFVIRFCLFMIKSRYRRKDCTRCMTFS